jgi:hypothetical protein
MYLRVKNRRKLLNSEDTLAIAHVADAITDITGNDDYDAVADQAARLYQESRSVAYAALCYVAGAVDRDQLLSVVRRELS